MEGVEILSIIPEQQILSALTIVGIIILSVCILAIIICVAIDIHDDLSGALAGVGLAIGTIIIIGSSIMITDRVTIPTQYEVIISEDVNYIEFTERYDVIEQRGKILVIKERENYKEANQSE